MTSGGSEESFAIAYDCERRRPGCVLVQVAMGGTVPSGLFAELFDPDSWLLAPTAAMKLYRASEVQLRIIAAKTDNSRRP